MTANSTPSKPGPSNIAESRYLSYFPYCFFEPSTWRSSQLKACCCKEGSGGVGHIPRPTSEMLISDPNRKRNGKEKEDGTTENPSIRQHAHLAHFGVSSPHAPRRRSPTQGLSQANGSADLQPLFPQGAILQDNFNRSLRRGRCASETSALDRQVRAPRADWDRLWRSLRRFTAATRWLRHGSVNGNGRPLL